MNQKLNMLKQLMAAFIVIAAIGGLASCEKYTYMPVVINPVDSVHFQAEIQPIFNANCISCHTSIRNPDLRDGKSYESLTTGGFVNLPGETSELYVHITTSSAHIPRTSDTEKQKILIWINQGAHNN
jgi:hypothetical protein